MPEQLHSKDIPVTREMFNEFKEEVYHRFNSIDHRFDSVDHKTESLDHKIEALEHKMDSKFELVMSELHAIRGLVEDQQANNKAVLDGYNDLYQRQIRLEIRQEEQERFLFSLKRYMES